MPPRQDVSFQRLPLNEQHLARFGVSLPGRGGFAPHSELSPEMANALKAALSADPMAPLPPEDVYARQSVRKFQHQRPSFVIRYFTYGVEMQKGPPTRKN